MVNIISDQRARSFRWLDITGPTKEKLYEIAREFGLQETLVQDCLEPEHFPKFERIGNTGFMIVRIHDPAATEDADTVRELTNKIAVFYSSTFIITVHRLEQPFLTPLRDQWKRGEAELARILYEILDHALMSYEAPLLKAFSKLEELETSIFLVKAAPTAVEEGYYLKRKASVFRRMLHLTSDILLKLNHGSDLTGTLHQDLKETCDSLIFDAEDLLENVTSLLHLHLGLASHRTNEIIRVLTLFSVFFLPLSFLAGVYGMNFEHMPELKWPLGYPFALALMLTVCLTIFFWFKRKGWLKW